MARPPHQPTTESRKLARTLSGYGLPQDQIAAEIGISEPTLLKHYRGDLDAGMRQANSRVVQSLFKKATGDGSQSVTAAIFWCKTRMGWSDKSQVEVTGRDGGPVHVSVDAEQALGELMAELAARKSRTE